MNVMALAELAAINWPELVVFLGRSPGRLAESPGYPRHHGCGVRRQATEPYTRIIKPRLLIPRQASSPEWTSL